MAALLSLRRRVGTCVCVCVCTLFDTNLSFENHVSSICKTWAERFWKIIEL